MGMWTKTAVMAGLIGAFALGVWVGPSITGRTDAAERVATNAEAPAIPEADVKVRPAATRRSAAIAARTARVEPTAPALQAELKPLLTSGAKMELAAEGFKDAEQFATVAHAARNTQVPFVLLKDRVLNKRKGLAAAIEEFKPDLDGATEATRARAAARADIDRLGRL